MNHFGGRRRGTPLNGVGNFYSVLGNFYHNETVRLKSARSQIFPWTGNFWVLRNQYQFSASI